MTRRPSLRDRVNHPPVKQCPHCGVPGMFVHADFTGKLWCDACNTRWDPADNHRTVPGGTVTEPSGAAPDGAAGRTDT